MGHLWRSSRELIRWHLMGAPFAAATFAAVAYRLESGASHPPEIWALPMLAIATLGILVLMTPVTVGVLSFWAAFACRYPAFEDRWYLKMPGLFLLAYVLAVAINVTFALGMSAVLCAAGGHRPVWDGLLVEQLAEFQEILFPMTCALVVIPRVLFNINPLAGNLLGTGGHSPTAPIVTEH